MLREGEKGGETITLVAKGELGDGAHAKAALVARDKVLRVRLLEAVGAARQADLADEALLLDHTNRELWDTSGEAGLVLAADARARALAADVDVGEVARLVTAAAGCVHHLLLHRHSGLGLSIRRRHGFFVSVRRTVS